MHLERAPSSSERGERTAIELLDVSKHFGSLAVLQGINLQIRAGERVALVGPSGAGKSTLLALLNGTLRPTHGRVRVLGRDLGQLTPRALRELQREVGTIYQRFHLVDNLRVIHNVNAGQLGRWPFLKAALSLVWPQEVESAAEALARVGIGDKLYERTDRLSGGQQQRVAIARVLVQDPAIILADEPIASLDPERSQEIMALLARLCRESGKTLVVSLHTIDYAYRHCDRILGLREGKLLFDAPPDGVTDEMVAALYRIGAEPASRERR